MCCESVIDRWLRKINSHCYNIYKIIIIIRLLLHLALFKDTSIAFTNIVTGHGIRLWFCTEAVLLFGNRNWEWDPIRSSSCPLYTMYIVYG